MTSYEIVWATARRAPIRAYFELEAQPDHRVVYTARLEIANINSMPRLTLISGVGIGSGDQIRRASVSAMVGIIRNSVVDEIVGRVGSLIKSFTPSAIGCSSPLGPTVFGPFRSCI